MTPLSSTRRSTNKASFNILTVLILLSSLQWWTTRRIGPFPSWTPLSNLRLMVNYPSLYTGNPHIQTNTYSGIVTITSQPNLVSFTPSPIGLKKVCSKHQLLLQEKEHLRKALTKYKYPKWALDKVEKRLNKSTSEVIDGANNQGNTAAQSVTSEVKTKGHIVIPMQKVFVKVSKRSVLDMAFKPASKVEVPSKYSWPPPRTKTLWSTKVVPYIGTNVVT